MKFQLFFIFILIAAAVQAQSKDELMIRAAMEVQKDAWNAGDIERYMSTYWNSDSLMFIGKTGVTYGWKQTLNNYKRSYPDAESMGKLDFDILQVKKVSRLYYYVTGKWMLKRGTKKGDLSGHFTLLFKKIQKVWKIVSDHSS